jgi:uncharacterized protein
MTEVERVVATRGALELIVRLRARLGPLVFHHSDVCDGSAPLFFQDGYLPVDSRGRLLGEIGGCKFFLDAERFEAWNDRQFIVDVMPVRGGMFSLDGNQGLRFITRSRIFTAEDLVAVAPPSDK